MSPSEWYYQRLRDQLPPDQQASCNPETLANQYTTISHGQIVQLLEKAFQEVAQPIGKA